MSGSSKDGADPSSGGTGKSVKVDGAAELENLLATRVSFHWRPNRPISTPDAVLDQSDVVGLKRPLGAATVDCAHWDRNPHTSNSLTRTIV